MTPRTAVVIGVSVVGAGVGLLAGGQRPTFRAGAELIAIDVQVVDREGLPVDDLRPADFDVQIDRRRRTVVSADFIRLDARRVEPPGSGGAPAASPAMPGSPAAQTSAGRFIVLAVDEASFHTRNAPAFIASARRFIQQLAPDDRIGVYRYPISPPGITVSTDHAAALTALGSAVGTFDEAKTEHHLSMSEVVDIMAGDREVLERVVRRECSPGEWGECRRFLIPAEARERAMSHELQVAQRVAALRTLFDGLRTVPGRKTLVLLSGGLLASDRVGGRPDVNGLIADIGQYAARSNTLIYVLHMDTSFLDMFSPTGRAVAQTAMRDSGVLGLGWDRFAGTAGAALIRVEAGTGDYAFDRLLRETSAYYLLGVAVDARDRDGRPHFIRVRVDRRGVLVRSRATVVIPASDGGAGQ